MKKVLKRNIQFVIMVIFITIILKLIHIFAHVLGIVTFSNIFDGMPFYYEQDYLGFVFSHFLYFFLIVFVLSVGLFINSLLFKKFVEFVSKKKFNKSKFFPLLFIYLLLSTIYLEFFALTSLTGPEISVPMHNTVFGIVILVAPLLYFLAMSQYCNKKEK